MGAGIKFGMVERIYGKFGGSEELYLFRVKLTPRTRWGQLYFHVFHRGDVDRAVHDHPWPWITFPFTSYWELVRHPAGRKSLHFVTRFRLHRRPATYTHRVLDDREGRKMFTLFWHGPKEREWGFWEGRTWTHWKEYLGVND